MYNTVSLVRVQYMSYKKLRFVCNRLNTFSFSFDDQRTALDTQIL